MRGRAATSGVVAATLLLAGCNPSVPATAVAAEDVPTVAGTVFDVKLEGCPSALKVSVPKGFTRAPDAEAADKKAVCESTVMFKPGTFECFFESWEPDVSFPYIKVAVEPHVDPFSEQGRIGKEAWEKHRARRLGSLQQDERAGHAFRYYPEGRANQDKGMAESIRGKEPSAPAKDGELRDRFPHFFRFPADAAPGPFTSDGGPYARHPEHLTVWRNYYARSCIVSVFVNVERAVDEPVTTLESWLSAISVK